MSVRSPKRPSRADTVIGVKCGLIVGLELGELADPPGEDRCEVLDRDVGGVKRVEVAPTRSPGGRPSIEGIQGVPDRARISSASFRPLLGRLMSLSLIWPMWDVPEDGGGVRSEVRAIIPEVVMVFQRPRMP